MQTRNFRMIVVGALSLTLSFAPALGRNVKAGGVVSADRDQIRVVSADRDQIERGIETYRHSIDGADTRMGASVFLDSPDTLFIHPRGTERGWSQVAANFYGKTMGETFTQRRLHLTAVPRIMVFKDAAVADFEWEFDATRRDNGKPLHTTGRETQTWIKLPKLGWRIASVHYSGPPQTGAGQGF